MHKEKPKTVKRCTRLAQRTIFFSLPQLAIGEKRNLIASDKFAAIFVLFCAHRALKNLTRLTQFHSETWLSKQFVFFFAVCDWATVKMPISTKPTGPFSPLSRTNIKRFIDLLLTCAANHFFRSVYDLMKIYPNRLALNLFSFCFALQFCGRLLPSSFFSRCRFAAFLKFFIKKASLQSTLYTHTQTRTDILVFISQYTKSHRKCARKISFSFYSRANTTSS